MCISILFLLKIKLVNIMNEILNIVLRTILVLVIIFFLFKLMGKKQVSQMDMFDYITGITIGSIVADISLDIEKNFIGGLICLLIYGFTSIMISYLSLKSISLRYFFDGKETILIENGNILRENLRKNKITINTLETEARLMGYFSLDEINNAILEPNGKISFEPQEQVKPATKKDMQIPIQTKGLVYNLIIDSTIIKENLSLAKVTEKWLLHELKIKGKKLSDIMLATVDNNQKLNLFYK